ncbi:MAG: MurR/RpiR family transcriptional regulator, partial [Aestuariivirga sp.]
MQIDLQIENVLASPLPRCQLPCSFRYQQALMQERFADSIQRRADDLTPSERRLVSNVLSQPRSAALATVTELARGAGVHEATVSRLARKLGFDGYHAFRQALQDEFIPSQETAQRMKRTIEASGDAGIISLLVEREVAALTTLPDHVGEADISAAAGRIMAARRIYIFGTGNAEVLVQMMAKRFRRYGREVQVLSGDARSLAEGVFGMGAEDVLVVYAFRRQPRAYLALMNRARDVGAATIVISGASGRLLRPTPDQLL